MNWAFWRDASPEQQAASAIAALERLPEEARSIVINHDGVMGDWVNATPLSDLIPGSGHVSTASAFTGTVAVYSCVALIAESIASLPLLLYERISDERRTRIPERNDSRGPMPWQNRVARMLHNSPNPEMTAQELWETVLGHVALWGNAYINVHRENGRPDALWPLRPDCMHIERDKNKVRRYRYEFPERGEFVYLKPSEVMHVRGMSLDGVEGVSPISVARSAVSITRAAEQFARGFYENGVTMAGLVVADPPLPAGMPPEKKRQELQLVREGLQELHGGVTKAHRVGVLSGVTWQNVGMPLHDAQFIETRKFQLNDIARLYRIPPHMVGDVEKSTSWGSGIEEQAIGFVTYTLRPWMRRIEQAINRDLGSPGEEATTLLDENIYAEFKADALLRGSLVNRYTAYGIGLDKQFLTVNDIRPLENLDPVEWGDEPNELPGAAPAMGEPEPEPAPLQLVPTAEENARTLYYRAMAEAAGRPVAPSHIEVRGPEQQTFDLALPPHPAIDITPLTEVVQRFTEESRQTREALQQDRESRELERDERDEQLRALIEASKPVPMRRKVVRDQDSNLVEVIDEPIAAEEA